MKPERIARGHLKPGKRRRIAERCERSGLRQNELARRHQISLSSLQRWLFDLFEHLQSHALSANGSKVRIFQPKLTKLPRELLEMLGIPLANYTGC